MRYINFKTREELRDCVNYIINHSEETGCTTVYDILKHTGCDVVSDDDRLIAMSFGWLPGDQIDGESGEEFDIMFFPKGCDVDYFHTNAISKPTKILYNDKTTILFWPDGSKEVVKCQKGDTFDPYNGFCIAFAKHFFGNNSALKKFITDHAKYQPVKIDIAKKEKPILDNCRYRVNSEGHLTSINFDDINELDAVIKKAEELINKNGFISAQKLLEISDALYDPFDDAFQHRSRYDSMTDWYANERSNGKWELILSGSKNTIIRCTGINVQDFGIGSVLFENKINARCFIEEIENIAIEFGKVSVLDILQLLEEPNKDENVLLYDIAWTRDRVRDFGLILIQPVTGWYEVVFPASDATVMGLERKK